MVLKKRLEHRRKSSPRFKVVLFSVILMFQGSPAPTSSDLTETT